MHVLGPDGSSNKPWGNGCFVCSPEKPCLFDVRADEKETTNLADAPGNSELVSRMAAKLAAYTPYAPGAFPYNP